MTEESPLIPRHTVGATVNVTVKEIPEEAVDKSGSIRLYGTSAEDFITPDSVSVWNYYISIYYSVFVEIINPTVLLDLFNWLAKIIKVQIFQLCCVIIFGLL